MTLKKEGFQNMIELSHVLMRQYNDNLHRTKQKLLYQIGVIDDPWKETEDVAEDGVFSEDSEEGA